MDVLKSFPPGKPEETSDGLPFQVLCWNCDHTFIVYIGYGNMMQCIFKCPHCDERVEIE